jgi:endonuclease/exonuclease/phosphatase family metal-dependent hydrolase
MMMNACRPLLPLLALSTLLGCGAAPGPVVNALPARATAAQAQAIAPAAQAGSAAAQRGFEATEAADATVASGVTLDLATLNTWGKPGILGKDQKNRFARIAVAVKPFGIVTMQETFTGYTDAMAKASGFPYVKRTDNGSFLHLNAGLLTLSRYRILETDFGKFQQATDFDRFANKGVLFTRLDVPGLGPVDLYNTHYQSVQSDKAAKIRLHDNAVLEALVKKHSAGYPAFVMGDFNMKPDSPEYTDLKARLKFRDTHLEVNPTDPGYTAMPENPYRKDDSHPKRIDFVFVLPVAGHTVTPTLCEVTFKEPVDGKVLSDHYGLHARFTVR